MKKLAPTLTLSLTALLAPTLFSQSVGGEWHKVYRFDGVKEWDMLGTAVSGAGDLDADGTPDLLVGVPQADSGGFTNNGTAIVYSGATGLEILRVEGWKSGILLGTSVSDAGDVNGDGYADIIVGALKANANGISEAGLAVVYSGIDGSEIYQLGGKSIESKLGLNVSGAGDVNADGYADVIVGGYMEDHNGLVDAGSAYVYSGRDGSLLYRFNGENSWDWFGHNVSDAGDVNNDGYADVMVGAINTSPNSINSAGSVYVYSGFNGDLLHRFNGSSKSSWYGWSLASAGDLNGDGHNDLLIGSPWGDSGGLENIGIAQAFSGATGAEIYRFEGNQEHGHFGKSLANAGDVDGDGVEDLLVGAYWESPGGNQSGAAYIWSGANGRMLKGFKGNRADDQLGVSVSGVGDLNADGLSEVIVGAMGKDPGSFESAGSVFVYSLDPYLHLSDSELSAQPLDQVQLDLDFPSSEASSNYVILASMHGTGPTIRSGLEIPLSPDGLFKKMLTGWSPSQLQQGMGVLDAAGDATAVLFGDSSLASAIGRSIYVAAISYDGISLAGRTSSIVWRIKIVN